MSFGTASTILSTAIHLVVGARLLYLARRTRALPETLVGGAMLLVGVAKAGVLLTPPGASFRGPVDALALALNSISHLMFYLVWWYVFRRRSRWAAGLCTAAALVLVAAFGWQQHLGWQPSGDGWGTWYNHVRMNVAGVGFAWGALECLGYWAQLKKRIRIGLAKPSTALRFLLWGVSMVSTLVILAGLNAQIELGLVSASAMQGTWAAMNLLSGICLWLSFLPPAALRVHLDSRAAEGAI